MNTARGGYCPKWCTATHSTLDLTGDDLVVHSRGFGNFADGELSPVQIWVIKSCDNIETSGVMIPVEDMHSSEDLRLLASHCLEAVTWIEENLGDDFFSQPLSTPRTDRFAI